MEKITLVHTEYHDWIGVYLGDKLAAVLLSKFTIILFGVFVWPYVHPSWETIKNFITSF